MPISLVTHLFTCAAKADSTDDTAGGGGGAEESTPVDEPSFAAFTGSGRRIDGKAASPAKSTGIPQRKGSGGASSSGAGPSSSRTPTGTTPPLGQGKSVLGSSPSVSGAAAAGAGAGAGAGASGKAASGDEETKASDDSFKAFSGKSYRLS